MPSKPTIVKANNTINIKGARVHNLKNINLEIPRNQMVVVTGVSGSGKSSLAFDTLFAEGQRRYVESLSSYARQFLGKLDKPDVDSITGISPAIAIEQKVVSRNARSTVGTTTEIYDYLKLLYARIGKTISPISGNEVKRHTVDDVLNFILAQPDGTKLALYAKIVIREDQEADEKIKILQSQGYSRLYVNQEFVRIEDALEQGSLSDAKAVFVVLDRISVSEELREDQGRLTDSINAAFFESQGFCHVETFGEKGELREFSNRFELDGMSFEEPSEHFFSYNNPVGACKTCEGYGSVIGIDPDAVIPNKSLSIFEEAIQCWKGEKMSEWKDNFVRVAHKFDFPVHRAIRDLTDTEYQLLWTGNKYFDGLNAFFAFLEKEAYKIQYRVMLSRYRGRTPCPDCEGSRLRKDARYVKVGNRAITEIQQLPISEALVFFQEINLNDYEKKVAERLLIEIISRLQFLDDVGLSYLTLNRPSNTLSGGESQRINLATSLGSALVGSLYILDEPSIGLHSKDTQRLIKVLRALNQLGNTVIIVEHDEEIMQAADLIIDMGPHAGYLGGEVVFTGSLQELAKAPNSLTAKYLTGKENIDIPAQRRAADSFIEVKGAAENNLKHVDVKFPLQCLSIISGVSGSGKSSLVKKVLYPGLSKMLGLTSGGMSGAFDAIEGDVQKIKAIEFIDQNPIGKSSRSNPVTYTKAFDEIRTLFGAQKSAKAKAIKSSHFSFNIPGGRCEECKGDGQIKVEMQFMADVYLKCETCNGHRYQEDILSVKMSGKNIYDVLELTVNQAIAFFKEEGGRTAEKIVEKLLPLQDVGLGYIKLGQPSNTLSGGEAQRIKLALFLQSGNNSSPTLFIFDEPTTGLHFDDVKKLLKAFDRLIDKGHTIIVIEHNLDVIKCGDWLIELGPEGGKNGGNLLFQGVPEDIAAVSTPTSAFLKEKLALV